MVTDSHIHAQRLAKANPRRLALLLFLIALAVRLIFLFFSPNNGNDAWLRYQDALFWSHHPTQLPPDANMWLPLHFWLLGAVLRMWTSQEAARLFTALLGALTVVPFWGATRRAFSASVAIASSLALALFGFHIGYSVTTSSEAPTIFFMAVALYGWVRLREDHQVAWGAAGGLALSAACLCRFEPWIAIFLFSILLLDFSRGWSSLVSNHASWLRAVCFAAPAAAGSVAWVIFSWVKWNDPFAVPHGNMLLTATVPAVLRHSLAFRLAVVPGSLLVSLDPIILILAAVGFVLVLAQGSSLARSIAILALVLAGTDYFNAVVNQVTQARFTLMYSWLLFPFACVGIERLAAYRARLQPGASSTTDLKAGVTSVPSWNRRTLYGLVAAFFLLWQAGIIAGAAYAPASLADRLGVMSPTLPLRRELRNLTGWLKQHTAPSDAVIIDSFDYDAGDIMRFAGLRTSQVFQVRNNLVNRALLKEQVREFVESRHPRFLVCAAQGPLCSVWGVDGHAQMDVESAGIRLVREWEGRRWRVYLIGYNAGTPTPSDIN